MRTILSRIVGSPSGAQEVDGYVAKSPALLLDPHRALLHEIRQLAGVTQAVWDACYSPAYRNLASLVQELPASEAHHHAEPGGLLRHALEVSLEALRIRQGHLLPPGASPEEIAARQDLWTYCCAMGGLLHDVGKPLLDQEIRLQDGSTWSILATPISPGTRYQVRFRPDRAHRSHERATALIARQVLPSEGLIWIASDIEALLAWLAALDGDHDEAGLMGSIIARADQISVSRDLARGIPARMPGSRVRPLSETLLNGLRELLRSGALPINRPGAAAFLVGDDLWLVSKRVLDKLRGFLTQDGQGIPSRNDRLMDELQQHGLLLANGDRAIWRCEIRLEDWHSTLTCLRMPAHLIWPDQSEAPGDFPGTVEPATDTSSSAESEAEDNTPSEEARSETPDATLQPSPATTTEPTLPLPPLGETPKTASDAVPAPEQAETLQTQAPEPDKEDETPPPPDLPEKCRNDRFLLWLREQINSGAARINTVDARIHVVPQGMVLVSPAIFRDFDPVNWRSAQRHFQRLKLHKKLPDETNIWTFKVEKDRKRSELKAYLIPDAEAKLGIRLPPPNKALALIEPATEAASSQDDNG